MKKIYSVLIYTAILILLAVFSCQKKENPDPEPSTTSTTTTGGTTTGGTTTGGTTTGGSTTGGSTTGTTGTTYTKVRITGFRVTDIANLQPQGWDPNDGPDVYYQVYKDDGTDKVVIDGFSDIRNNVGGGNLPLVFTFPQPYVIGIADDFHLSLYDHDGSTREIIGGSTFRFNYSDYASHPTVVEKTYSKCTWKIYLEWLN